MSWSRSDAFSISVSLWITICPFLVMEKIHLLIYENIPFTNFYLFLDFKFINNSGFRICVKELFVQQFDPLTVSYAVLAGIMRSIAFSITIKYWIKTPPILAKYYWQKQWRCTFFSKLLCLSVIRQRFYLTIEVNIKAESSCES